MALIKTDFERIVFVLSTGRTGTQAVARVLSEGFESVLAVHEPSPSRRLRLASCAYLNGRRTPAQMASLLANARKGLSDDHRATVYIESNAYLFGFIEVLDEVFDCPRIVHITRDPRSMVRSALNFGSQRGIKRILSAVVTDWMIKPEYIEPMQGKTWRRMSPIERYAWFWRIINGHLNRGETLFGERYIRIRFEDLFQPHGAGIRELADWIGLREREGVLSGLLATKFNASRGRGTPAWDHWSDFDRDIVAEQCGPLMQQYGYAPVA